MATTERSGLFIRNVVFGIEDSLVSTVGLLSGIAAVGVPHAIVLMTGFVLIFVEGVSMAIGSFLSEESAQEYERGASAASGRSFLGALVMLVSYVIAGLVPVAPYLFAAGLHALYWSIGLSLTVLALLGYAQARFSGLPAFSRALRMCLLGGFAIVVGVAVGSVFGIA